MLRIKKTLKREKKNTQSVCAMTENVPMCKLIAGAGQGIAQYEMYRP